ncbi:uracil-DNA glycosylase [Rhodovulum sp. YNF3179]|uniref:uracil-DNA glycosylase n=1 Tax=Rhodovulum sp. YNF3179 TaxID=3425127 RepID=UPI003D33B55D
MDRVLDFHTAKAMLEWQIELGATEAIGETPVDRYAAAADPAPAAPAPGKPPQAAVAAAAAAPAADPAPAGADAVEAARSAAAEAHSLEGLRYALSSFAHCELKKGARNTVFSDGNPEARVMIVGEAPGRDEDIEGKSFVGRAGKLLDRMFDAIGLARAGSGAAALYITNVMPWRPPQNRDPTPEEIAMMLPFVERHVELVAPDILVLMGNTACQALLGRKGITRLRGHWAEVLGRPALPMFHPAYLLRNPAAKREAWHDLLMIRHRLEEEG